MIIYRYTSYRLLYIAKYLKKKFHFCLNEAAASQKNKKEILIFILMIYDAKNNGEIRNLKDFVTDLICFDAGSFMLEDMHLNIFSRSILLSGRKNLISNCF